MPTALSVQKVKQYLITMQKLCENTSYPVLYP